jgi:hypothetical protein
MPNIPPKLIIVVAAVALAVAASAFGVDMETVKGFLGLLEETPQ